MKAEPTAGVGSQLLDPGGGFAFIQRLKAGKHDVDAILRQLTGRQHRAQLPAIVNKRDIQP
ncbi:hypothetical protein LNP74_20635 [Klebsiella pneumoniae subsp. pneumoniae]|nr:hypothetical protein [Klebsiella pneumoniae subsp. pneumoniae]